MIDSHLIPDSLIVAVAPPMNLPFLLTEQNPLKQTFERLLLLHRNCPTSSIYPASIGEISEEKGKVQCWQLNLLSNLPQAMPASQEALLLLDLSHLQTLSIDQSHLAQIARTIQVASNQQTKLEYVMLLFDSIGCVAAPSLLAIAEVQYLMLEDICSLDADFGDRGAVLYKRKASLDLVDGVDRGNKRSLITRRFMEDQIFSSYSTSVYSNAIFV